MSKLIVILGPTASGKTELAIKLARFYNGEIVSADSRQIYRGMNIGTAKAVNAKLTRNKNTKQTRKIIQEIPFHLIDIINPNQNFTVADFKERAIKIIKEIQKGGKIPFLVGGTGLYISAVVDNLKIPKVVPDKKLRAKIEKQIKKNGLNWAWQKLLKLDPEAAEFVQKDNPRRIIRALEVCLKTKKRFSDLRKIGKPLFDVLQIGIKLPRKTLYKKINQRVDKMVKNGLIEEVKRIYKKLVTTETQKQKKHRKRFRDFNLFRDSVVAIGISNLPSLSGIGYREIVGHLQGKIDLEDAIEEIKKNTRHFARRQTTWFKRDPRIRWIKKYQEAKKIIAKFLLAHKGIEPLSGG